jgi:hypothetical protein
MPDNRPRWIVDDARAVVSAANAADASLPDANLGADIRPRFEAVQTSAEMAALRSEAELKRDQALAVGGALAALSQRVADWQIPAVVTTPIAERDFETAAQVAAAAESWVLNAWEADQKLARMDAITRVKPLFEGAETLEDLEAGAELAESWNLAAGNVRNAVDAVEAPRDLLSQLGLFGTDVTGPPPGRRSSTLSRGFCPAAWPGGRRLRGRLHGVSARGSSSGARPAALARQSRPALGQAIDCVSEAAVWGG